MANCANLPCSSSTSSVGIAFEIKNLDGYGIRGYSRNGAGLYGYSYNDLGVYGLSNSYTGVYGLSSGHIGVHGFSYNNVGVYGYSGTGYAGYFNGRVYVSGYLTKAGGGFKIDHPLDSANKYLNHSFVESPEMKNLYDGVVTLDKNGEAIVELPEWFEALNQDFRYQLTCIGEYAPVYVAQKIEKSRLRNSFKIAGGISGIEVSWQVTGVRCDRWAQANSITVEEDKSENQRGYYLHPEVYGQSEEKSIEWADNPEMMRQMKEERENPPSIEIPEL